MKLTNVALISALSLTSLVGVTQIASADSVRPYDIDTTGVEANSHAKGTFIRDTDGNKGDLRIDSLTDISFGGFQSISGNAKTYHAVFNQAGTEFAPTNIRITDNRGSNVGWTLKVANTQFKTEDAAAVSEGKETLTGAKLSFKHLASNATDGDQTKIAPVLYAKSLEETVVTIDGSGTAEYIINAPAEAGIGTWLNEFGDVKTTAVTEDASGIESPATTVDSQTLNNAIDLFVPGATKKAKDVEYKSILTWTLEDAPK